MLLGSLLLLAALVPALGKACMGKDLPADSSLHITVVNKPSSCPRQSAPGDKMTM